MKLDTNDELKWRIERNTHKTKMNSVLDRGFIMQERVQEVGTKRMQYIHFLY